MAGETKVEPAAEESYEVKYERCEAMLKEMPVEVREWFVAMADQVASIGEECQLSPDHLIVALSAAVAGIVICNVAPDDETEFDRRINFAGDMVNIYTAIFRLNAGLVPPGCGQVH